MNEKSLDIEFFQLNLVSQLGFEPAEPSMHVSSIPRIQISNMIIVLVERIWIDQNKKLYGSKKTMYINMVLEQKALAIARYSRGLLLI